MRRLLLLLASVACAPDVPAMPTWTEDVMPIIRANCVRCHGEDTSGGAPTTFHLDRWIFGQEDGSYEIPGAFTMRDSIAERISKEGGELPPMPPNGPPLSDRQKDILVAWAGLDAVTSLGPPTTPPRIQLSEPLPAVADEQVVIRTLVEDDEHEFVRGELWYGAGEPQIRITSGVRSGLGTHIWDSATAAPGTYLVFAKLEDDSRQDAGHTIETRVGQVTIDHASGAAPRITFDPARADDVPADCSSRVQARPRRDDLYHPSLPEPDRTIRMFAHDADGDPLSVTFEAIGGGMVVPLGAGTVANCAATLVPDLSLIPDGTSWRFRATASDGTHTRTATSKPVIVSSRAPTVTYSEIETLLRDPQTPCFRCEGCHEGSTGVCSNVVDVYVQPFGSIDDYLGKIYRKVVEREEMPPESARTITPGFTPWLTRADRDRIGEWLLGGACDGPEYNGCEPTDFGTMCEPFDCVGTCADLSCDPTSAPSRGDCNNCPWQCDAVDPDICCDGTCEPSDFGTDCQIQDCLESCADRACDPESAPPNEGDCRDCRWQCPAAMCMP
jgi:hypothetical protein